MKRKSMLVGALVLGLLLAVAAGMTQAQGPELPEGEADLNAVSAAAGVANRIPIQGRLTDAGGNPLNGTYSIRFALYEVDSGGAALCADTNSVEVENGLFYSEIWGDCGTDDINGRQLYLGVKVGADPEMTPRQAIYPVPYAFSLRPGAVISDTLSGNAIVHIENWANAGRGLRAYAMDEASTNYGVVGASRSPNGYGGYFYNNGGGVGLYGSSTVSMAVVGLQSGYTLDDLGLWVPPGGFFGGNIGIIGYSKSAGGTGVLAWTTDTNGWAGRFSGVGNGVHISVPAGKTGLNVVSGTKNAVVKTNSGARLLYTEESTEVWFTDYGFGKLEAGVAIVSIDPTFAQTVNLEEPYHVFVQVYGNAEVYVSERTPTQFEVRLRDGDPNVEFSYRIVGKRLGYESDRLEHAPWADDDPNLYP